MYFFGCLPSDAYAHRKATPGLNIGYKKTVTKDGLLT